MGFGSPGHLRQAAPAPPPQQQVREDCNRVRSLLAERHGQGRPQSRSTRALFLSRDGLGFLLKRLFENCELHRLTVRGDERGSLIALEEYREVPFGIARVYSIVGGDPGTERGFHAHRNLHQLAICVGGSCTVVVSNGSEKHEVRLNRPDEALHIGPMIWHEMRDFSPDCALMVLASAYRDEANIIRNETEFDALSAAGKNA